MERNNLIPSVDTNDLEPKTPWELQREQEIAAAAEKLHEEQEAEAKKPVKKERSLFVKALLAILIVGGIIGIGILLPIKLVPSASSLVSSVFNSSSTNSTSTSAGTASSTVIFAPDKTSIKSEEVVKLSWNGPVRQDGQYTLTFPCADGLAIILIAADGTKYTVPCDAPFNFVSIDNTLTLAIQSRFQRLAEVPLSFSFTDAAGTVTHFPSVEITVINNFPETGSATSTSNTSDGGTIIADNGNTSSGTASNSGGQAQTGTISTGPGHTIFDSANPQAGNTNTNTGTTGTTNGGGTTSSGSNTGGTAPAPAPTPSAPKYYGKADLTVRVLATGILDKNTGAFIPTQSFNAGDRVAVRFEIVNTGTNVSGHWNFNAIIPTSDIRTFQSAEQVSLAPNGRIVFTLGFDNLTAANNASVIIDADPSNAVSESSETNNTATAGFGASGAVSIGSADLKATLIGVGRMNGSTFIPSNSITTDDRAAMQFRVTNIGGKTSGTWNFKAGMTHSGSNAIYNSNAQAALKAGQSTIITIAFDNPSAGVQSFEALLDPSGQITDANRSNNDISASIRINN